MSIADISTNQAGLGVGRVLAVRLRGCSAWLLRRNALFIDRSRLHAMPDHMLRDIGLTRDGIDEALRDARAKQAPAGLNPRPPCRPNDVSRRRDGRQTPHAG